jgi:predicted SprT family Zn-dependent metalloprotease
LLLDRCATIIASRTRIADGPGRVSETMEQQEENTMQVRYQPCGCDQHYRKRQRRSWWMRLFWSRRLYLCKDCRQYLLIPEPRPDHPPLTQTPHGA